MIYGFGVENVVISNVQSIDKSKIGTTIYKGKSDLIDIEVATGGKNLILELKMYLHLS